MPKKVWKIIIGIVVGLLVLAITQNWNYILTGYEAAMKTSYYPYKK